jgi:carbon monoxide dehydrogenase subunit G
VELNVDREVAASPERVWSIITDLEGYAEVLSGVERTERIDDGQGFGVGTRWRETRVVFGKESTEEMEVTDVEDGHSYTVSSESRGTRYTSMLRVEPIDDDRSRLSMSFGAQPAATASRLLAATIGRAFQGATRKMLQRDLDDIAATAEAAPTT